jgi:DNA-binding NtrC family response regulator
MSTQTSSSMFQTLIQRIVEAARSSDNLCIIGEVGTGKRQAAVSVHRGSGSDKGRMSIVNCMALDHENFLSDLFGRVTPDVIWDYQW